MSLNNKKLKKSGFSFLFSNKNKYYAIYHSLSCEVIYGGKLLRDIFTHFIDYNTYNNFLKANTNTEPDKLRKLCNLLYEKGVIVENDIQDKKMLRNLQKQVRDKNFIKTLYLSLTYRCNFRCSYCISNNSLALGRNNKILNLDMSKEVAKMAADYYLHNAKDEGDKEVVFYGGEPLLNFDVLKFLVNYINEKEGIKKSKNRNYKRSRFILCTNGSLIDEEKASFIKENNIYPAVTFDGDKKTHNKVRRYVNNKGTYEDVIVGYRKLQKLNFPIGITLTLGRHNVKKLAEFIKLFADQFKPYTIATNTMVDYEDGGNEYVCDGSILANNLIKAFRVARNKGMYIVKYVMDNRVKPLVEKLPRLKGCTGTGSRIMVLPDGALAACAAYAKNSKVKLQDNPKVKDFIPFGIEYYSPFFKNQCRFCPAISCCGGGCPKNAEIKHGTFWGLDDDYCIQSKKFLEWLIWDLFDFLDKRKLAKNGFLYPTSEDRRKIYGNIKVYKSPLDFQYTPNVSNL